MNMLKGRTKVSPEKPIVIYDGHCGFCKQRVAEWKKLPGIDVQFAPSDDALVQTRFPELLTADLQASVHYIDRSGRIFAGAEAVFLVLKQKSLFYIFLWFYRKSSLFARLSEAGYRWIARRRHSFSCSYP